MNTLEQPIDENMLIRKILSVPPDDYKLFNNIWDSTSKDEKTLQNCIVRLPLEEEKCESGDKCEGRVAFRTPAKIPNNKIGARYFECNKIGHFARQCPRKNKMFCSLYKKPNHEEKDSFKRRGRYCSICKKNNH